MGCELRMRGSGQLANRNVKQPMCTWAYTRTFPVNAAGMPSVWIGVGFRTSRDWDDVIKAVAIGQDNARVLNFGNNPAAVLVQLYIELRLLVLNKTR